jgi:adenosylhomocysteine nucleosidase
LRAGLAAGRVYPVAGVVDSRTGERFTTGPIRSLAAAAPVETTDGGIHPGSPAHGAVWLVTCERVANRADKPSLAAAHGAGLVDMEAAAVARAAGARGIPFHCVKGVSDGPEDRLPDFNRFITAEGEFRLGPFIGFAALRPWTWRPLLRLGAASRRSAQALRPAVLRLLDDLTT